jgi:hypothetical protein
MARSGFDGFRLSLARSRERGAPFEGAWKVAMRMTHPSRAISLALKDTKREWQAAYERLPATSGDDAVARLAAWLDQTPEAHHDG